MNAVIVFVCDDGRWFYTGTTNDEGQPVIAADPDDALIYVHGGCAATDYHNHAKPIAETMPGSYVFVSDVEAEREIIAERMRAGAR